jgi:hypothetical protein
MGHHPPTGLFDEFIIHAEPMTVTMQVCTPKPSNGPDVLEWLVNVKAPDKSPVLGGRLLPRFSHSYEIRLGTLHITGNVILHIFCASSLYLSSTNMVSVCSRRLDRACIPRRVYELARRYFIYYPLEATTAEQLPRVLSFL